MHELIVSSHLDQLVFRSFMSQPFVETSTLSQQQEQGEIGATQIGLFVRIIQASWSFAMLQLRICSTIKKFSLGNGVLSSLATKFKMVIEKMIFG